MKRRTRGSLTFLALLMANLAVWDIKGVVWLTLADPDYPFEAYRDRGAVPPDARLPKLTAENGLIYGMAPGTSSDEEDQRATGISIYRRLGFGQTETPPAARTAYPAPRLFVSSGSLVSPLGVSDPSELVLPPSDGGATPWGGAPRGPPRLPRRKNPSASPGATSGA
ncbi:MAG: hypothetical protein HY077_10655 [Elusimicrobia bacterium]|nr:hypothetical protein [Elusimicrobiota bacterium]